MIETLINLFLDGAIIVGVSLLLCAFMCSGLWAILDAGEGKTWDENNVEHPMNRVKRILLWGWAFFVTSCFVGGFYGLCQPGAPEYLRSLLP